MPSREIAVHMQISPSEYIVGLRGVKIEVDGTGTGALLDALHIFFQIQSIILLSPND